jgi:hypothetical protein
MSLWWESLISHRRGKRCLHTRARHAHAHHYACAPPPPSSIITHRYEWWGGWYLPVTIIPWYDYHPLSPLCVWLVSWQRVTPLLFTPTPWGTFVLRVYPIYMYIYMCVYMHRWIAWVSLPITVILITYMYVYPHIYTCMYIHIYICIYIYVSISYIHMCIYVYTDTWQALLRCIW